MMPADLNLHVWLDTERGTTPAVVIPYVESEGTRELQYQILTIKKGSGGSSRISQGGVVTVQAGQPTPLARFSVSVQPNDRCRIDLILTADDGSANTWQFNCPGTSGGH